MGHFVFIIIKPTVNYDSSYNNTFVVLQVISIVVFASVSSQGYAISPTKERYCLYNENPNACNYGVGGTFLVLVHICPQLSS